MRADWRLFAPRLFEVGAYVEALGSVETDDLELDPPHRHAEWRDRYANQKLVLFGNGYVYHPRFLLFNVRVGGAFKQEDYRSTFASAGSAGGSSGAIESRTSGSGLEYDARVLLLPEHPYNLELFALRYEPVGKERLATVLGNVETDQGANFRYRRDPFRVLARYDDLRIETRDSSARAERLGLNAVYTKLLRDSRRVLLTASFDPSRFSDSGGLRGTSREAHLDGSLSGRAWSGGIGAGESRSDQTGGASSRIEANTRSWYGQLTGNLPLHLRTDLAYHWDRREDSFSDFTVDPSAIDRSRLAQTATQLRFDLVHKLYQSLDTTYVFLRNTSSSPSGETQGTNHNLDLAYTKVIPWGRVLAGVNLGRGDTESSGRADIANEAHSAVAVPGAFRLAEQNVARESLAVFLKSPVAPFELVLLEENVHYTVTDVAPTLEIFVFALPERFAVPGTFEFVASYSLLTASFALRTDTLGHRASVPLFDDFLTPYYAYNRTRSKVLSGAFPGSGLESSVLTTGLRARRAPWQAVVEYQDVRWDVNPYSSWRGELQYSNVVNPRVTFYAILSRIDRHYRGGTLGFSGGAYDDSTQTASGNLQTRFFDGHLTLSLGGSYSRLQGPFDSTTSALNSTLTWRVGLLDFTAGASGYQTDTEGSGRIASSRRGHRYYYLKMRRKLF